MDGRPFLSMGPDDENIINGYLPDDRGWCVVVYKSDLKLTHESVGIECGHSCTHGCSTNLQIVFLIEVEIVFS